MVVNDPETVAELRGLYPRYEEALVSNDVNVLKAMFWASSLAIRFGAGENLCMAWKRSRCFGRTVLR